MALLLAVAVRLVPWSSVFTAEGVRFVADGDPYYHVLRARIAAQEHRLLWRDPGLDHPLGADVPWPPLLEAFIAAGAWIAGGGTPPTHVVETVAAVVPVVLGVLGVLAGALLALEVLGPPGAVAAAFALAVLPANASYAVVGRPDQHVLEALLLTGMCLVYAREIGGRRPRPGLAEPAALGILLTGAFWTWLGSALHVAVLCTCVAAAHVLAPPAGAARAARLVGLGAAVAAASTAVTFALFGPDGALHRVALGGVSAFPVVVTGGAAAFCAALWSASRRWPDAGRARRAAEAVLAAGVVGGGILCASAAVRDAVVHGLAAAGRTNAWYAAIVEFAPIFTLRGAVVPQVVTAFSAFGLLPLLAAVGVLELCAWWRGSAERRALAVFVATLAALFIALTAYMLRFMYYAPVPLALLGAMGLAVIGRRASALGRAGPAAVAGVAVITAASLLLGLTRLPIPPPRLDAILRAVGPLRDTSLPGGAVLVRWDAGHHARYASGRPGVASPFGTEGGPDALADVAAFFLAEDPVETAALLARRGVRWVVLDDPANAVLEATALAGSPNPPVVRVGDPLHGFAIHCEERYDRLVAARLYYAAGAATPAQPVALGGFRLISDSGAASAPVRLFEVVPGAVVEIRGAQAGAPVEARVDVTTALGSFPWRTSVSASEDGRAELTLPFSSGRNGQVRATPYWITAGTASAMLSLDEDEVRRGAHVALESTPTGLRLTER